jgi:hypothetical protein
MATTLRGFVFRDSMQPQLAATVHHLRGYFPSRRRVAVHGDRPGMAIHR